MGEVNQMPSELRVNCMFYDTRRQQLISGSNVIEVYPLSRATRDAVQIPHTHDSPLAVVSPCLLLVFYPTDQGRI